MMVAGLELISVTRSPSSLRTRQAWVPVSSNSQAWQMTIGPEPMTRTWLISLRFGMVFFSYLSWSELLSGASVVGHQVNELIEQWVRIMWTCGRFWVVLHRVRHAIAQSNAFD